MKIHIVMTKCKRCGKSLAKTDKSLYGAEKAKAQYGDICSDCMSSEEKFDMLQEQAKAILSL